MEISTKTFFWVGMCAFFVIASMNALNLIMVWEVTNIYGKVGSIVTIIFYLVTSLYFATLLKNMMPQENKEPVDIEEIIKEVKDGRRA